VASAGVTFILSFVKVCQLVEAFSLKGEGGLWEERHGFVQTKPLFFS